MDFQNRIIVALVILCLYLASMYVFFPREKKMPRGRPYGRKNTKYGKIQSARATNILLSDIRLLNERGVSNEEIGKLAGINPAAISKYRNGVKPMQASADKLRKAINELRLKHL